MNNFEIIASKEIWKIWFIMGRNKIIWNVEINEMKKMTLKLKKCNNYGKQSYFLNMAKTSHGKFWKIGWKPENKLNWEKIAN